MPFPSPRLLRCGLAAAALTIAFSVMPGPAQSPDRGRQRPSSPPQPQPSLAGLPLYTSDGKQIGKVISMGVDDDNAPLLVAEVARPLGLGPMAIAVPPNMFVRKGNRIELTITEAEVNAKLKD